MKTELLAPAKDKYTAFAAIDCGADAVYIGCTSFGARKNAANSLEDIKEVVEYAHKFWAKVYVTVNTILTDSELDEAVELVKKLDKIDVDAVLIQDMGLLNKLMQINIRMPLHASTQCDNRNVEKVGFLNSLGLSRVVLARELSIKQVREIHEKYPNVELEAFVHGALCVSYSGQCYLSQYIGGRSANRGECAQPCRKKYSVLDESGNIIKKDFYALCLKDFNASNHIKEMIDAGIFSFKIEGRLKDIGYVKNVVSYYRQLLDNYSDKSSSGRSQCTFTPDVEKSFNRGFTDYFLNGRGECYNQISPKSRGKYIGKIIGAKGGAFLVETGMDINSQDGLCFFDNDEMEGFLVNKSEKTDRGVLIYPNRQIKFKTGTKLYRNLDIQFEKELLQPVKRQIDIVVNIESGKIELKDEDGISIIVDIPSKEQAKNQEKMNETFIKQFSKTGESDFYITKIELSGNVPFMPISEINKLRRDAFDKLMQKRLLSYKREERGEMPNSAKSFTPKELDYRANIHNTEAEKFYKKYGFSVKERSLETKIPNRQIELMRTKHCIKYALNMCKSPQKLILQDEKGVKYPLAFDCKNCEMAVLSPGN